mgnify:FL=1
MELGWDAGWLSCIVRKLRGAGISLIYQRLYLLANKIKLFISDISIGGKQIFCHQDQKAAPLFALHLIGGYGHSVDPKSSSVLHKKQSGKKHHTYCLMILPIFKTNFLLT